MAKAEGIRFFDLFGRSISLNIHGQDTFKTMLGGLFSIAMLSIVFAYSVFNLTNMVTSTSADLFHFYEDMQDEYEISYLKMQMSDSQQQVADGSQLQVTLEPSILGIETPTLKPCDNDAGFQCLEKFKVDKSQKLTISLTCPGCPADTINDSFFFLKYNQTRMVDLDFKVGYKAEEKQEQIEYDNTRSRQYFMSLQKNLVEANDRLTQIGFKKSFWFNSWQFGSQESRPVRNPESGLVMQLTILPEQLQVQHIRNVYGIFDLMGEIGGFYEGIFFLIFIWIVFIEQAFYQGGAIRDLYLVQERTQIQKDAGGKQDRYSVFKQLIQRRKKLPPYYKVWLGTKFCCMCSKQFKKWDRYQQLVNQGYIHLRQELDIVRMLRKVRMTYNAVWGMTTAQQRKICRHQALLVLRGEHEIASDSEDLYGGGLNLDFIDQVKNKHTDYDKKLLKRLIDTQIGKDVSDPSKSFKIPNSPGQSLLALSPTNRHKTQLRRKDIELETVQSVAGDEEIEFEWNDDRSEKPDQPNGVQLNSKIRGKNDNSERLTGQSNRSQRSSNNRLNLFPRDNQQNQNQNTNRNTSIHQDFTMNRQQKVIPLPVNDISSLLEKEMLKLQLEEQHQQNTAKNSFNYQNGK